MKSKEVLQFLDVSQSRLNTIAKHLLGGIASEYTDDQVSQIESVVSYMADNGLKSVKAAISQMKANQSQGQPSAAAPDQVAQSTEAGTVGFQQQLEDVLENASDEYADIATAMLVTKTLGKIGTMRGARSQAAMENFTQALIPTAEFSEQSGFVLAGAGSSTRLLSGSATE